MPKRIMLLVNPNAGKGGYKTSLTAVIEEFCRGNYLPTVFFTRHSGHAPELVERYAADYDLVVCLGGDGTLSEVVTGMMNAHVKRPIGYIPYGTANDVARTLELSSHPTQAAKTIVKGNLFPLDVGQFGTDKFFTYVAAFGAFTEVSYATPQEKKHVLGHMAYMLEGIKSLNRLSHYRAIVEYDGGVIEDDFIFGAVTNSTSIAGLVKLDRGSVNISDGMFEVLLVRNPQDLAELNNIISAILLSNFNSPSVLFFRRSEVRIMFEQPVAWTRDGEDGGSHRDVMIVNRHPGVELII